MAGRGAEEEELKPIHGVDLGTWLKEKLENLSAAPDELDHACREARDFASHFRVSYDIFLSIMEAAKPVFSICTHDGGCAHFKGGIDVLSAIPHSIRILVELLSLLARQQKWYYHLQQAQSLIPYNYIPYIGTLVVCSSLYLLSTVLLYTTYCLKKNAVVHQSVPVEYYYCCFHLNYCTTTVGPDTVIRNKKHSLLCTPYPR